MKTKIYDLRPRIYLYNKSFIYDIRKLKFYKQKGFFEEGLARLEINEKWTYINSNGVDIFGNKGRSIKGIFYSAGIFSDGLSWVEVVKNGKLRFTYIKKDGTDFLGGSPTPKFRNLSVFRNGIGFFDNGENFGYVNILGMIYDKGIKRGVVDTQRKTVEKINYKTLAFINSNFQENSIKRYIFDFTFDKL